jgi:hypothetical protein
LTTSAKVSPNAADAYYAKPSDPHQLPFLTSSVIGYISVMSPCNAEVEPSSVPTLSASSSMRRCIDARLASDLSSGLRKSSRRFFTPQAAFRAAGEQLHQSFPPFPVFAHSAFDQTAAAQMPTTVRSNLH